MVDDAPRSLRHREVLQRRQALLTQPHVAPLVSFVQSLRRQSKGEVPNFDPLDGGIAAKMMFLFEKPGPMTSMHRGPGFISRNNDDPSAEATFHFMQEARIPRKLTITWNIIPWWNGTRKISAAELRSGLDSLGKLIGLLPDVSVVVLVGNAAAKARPFLEQENKSVILSAHPSPLVRASAQAKWKKIPAQWASAMDFIHGR